MSLIGWWIHRSHAVGNMFVELRVIWSPPERHLLMPPHLYGGAGGWRETQQLPFIQLQQNPCDPELRCPFIQYSRRVQLLYPLCCECKYECLIYLKVQPCRSVHARSPHSYFILMNMRTLARSLMSSAAPSLAVCAPSSSMAPRSSHAQSMTKAFKVSLYYYLLFFGWRWWSGGIWNLFLSATQFFFFFFLFWVLILSTAFPCVWSQIFGAFQPASSWTEAAWSRLPKQVLVRGVPYFSVLFERHQRLFLLPSWQTLRREPSSPPWLIVKDNKGDACGEVSASTPHQMVPRRAGLRHARRPLPSTCAVADTAEAEAFVTDKPVLTTGTFKL